MGKRLQNSSINHSKLIYLIIFLIFFGVNLIAYRLVFGLSLYGDDWAVIAKFFHIYGPGNAYPYYRLDTWVYDYGFMLGIFAPLSRIFGYQPEYFYLTSLLFRTILTFSIYYFIQKVFSKNIGIATALFFSISSIGAETTEWVFQMSAYLGIAITLFGLAGLVNKDKPLNDLKKWVIIIFGYVVVPIRLYLIPFFLPFLELSRWLITDRKNFKSLLYGVIVSGSLFPILKYFFPSIANADWNAIRAGIAQGNSLIASGRIDFFLYPFLNIGRMVFPTGFEEFGSIFNLDITFKGGFLLTIIILVFLGSSFFSLAGKQITKSKIYRNVLIAVLIFVCLRIFTHYQGQWFLKDFAKFSWTYIGIILLSININKLYRGYTERDWPTFFYSLITFVFTISFAYSQITNPLFIPDPVHRYLLLPGIGIVFLLSSLLFQNFNNRERGSVMLKTALILLILISHLLALNSFLGFMQSVRSKNLNDRLFSQIRQNFPNIPMDKSAIFYFEYPDPTSYHLLLRFGFGYHMLLYYNIPFDEVNMPLSASNLQELLDLIKQNQTPPDHIYGLKWVGDIDTGRFADISNQVRDKVGQIQ